MAHPEHIVLAKTGANAIARWRELTFMIPNPNVAHYSLNYRLEDGGASETYVPERIHGRARLDLSGAFLSGAKLAGADLSQDNLSRVDLTGCNLRFADLGGANLNSAYLSRSNLSHANFRRANMNGCSLVRSTLSNSNLQTADLKSADLSFAKLDYANLEGADLSGSDLSSADLSWANLSRANLRGANLTAATLELANLSGADLRGAAIINADLESAVFLNTLLGITRFVNCDLSTVMGLDSARHFGPSVIGLDTLARSGGSIPKAFLEKAGVAAPLVAAQDAMKGATRAYPTVLIIGSSEDGRLAGRLRSGLAAAQIPCWSIAADDEAGVRSGEINFGHTVYYDRLVLLCTAQSLENPQASRYLAELAGKQRPESLQTIIALAADSFLYDRDDRLCRALKRGMVLDFRSWEEDSGYEEALSSLVRVLSATGP